MIGRHCRTLPFPALNIVKIRFLEVSEFLREEKLSPSAPKSFCCWHGSSVSADANAVYIRGVRLVFSPYEA